MDIALACTTFVVRMRRAFAFLLMCLSWFSALRAQPQSAPSTPFLSHESPKREARAVWLTTLSGLDWPSEYANGSTSSIASQKKELTDILDKLSSAGINIVLLQTRIRATTIYPSAYEPWDKCLTGTAGVSPGYDPLAFAITECHKRGMELHAWVVAIPVGKWNEKGCVELRRKYPSIVKRIGEDGFMNPESSLTGDYIANICEEITKKYDIDGIHLDYIRYPETWTIRVSKERGRQYITDIVRKVSQKVKAEKGWVKVSCSPVGKFDDLPRQSSFGWNAYSRVCQDAQGWLRMGLMDCLFPMMYFQDEHFFPFVLDWQEHTYGRIVAPGLGIYFLSPQEKNWRLRVVTEQMEVLRLCGLGHAFFRSRFFTDNTKGLYSFTRGHFDHNLALVPAMTWEKKNPPTAPQNLNIDTLSNTLSWGGAKDESGSDYLMYNVYTSDEYPVDVSKGSNLILMRTQKTAVKVPLGGQYYAVTAMDRYGNESSPIQQIRPKQPSSKRLSQGRAGLPPIFSCDGRSLYLGNLEINNSDILQIETLQGRVLKTTFSSKNVNVSDLPEGFYCLRSIGKKNVLHRLGFFKVERR